MITGAPIQYQVRPYEVYGGQSGTETGFTLSTAVFFPVGIIPAMLHTCISLIVADAVSLYVAVYSVIKENTSLSCMSCVMNVAFKHRKVTRIDVQCSLWINCSPHV